MTFKNYLGLFGALLVAAGGMSPMLHIGIISKDWNYWDIDITLAAIIYFFTAAGLLAAITGKQGLLRFCGWMVFLVLAFTLVAVYFKVNSYFSFIPLKKLAMALTRIVHYRWTGWAMILAGSFTMILAGRRNITEKQLATIPEVPPAPIN
jgi:hypothetical protein